MTPRVLTAVAVTASSGLAGVALLAIVPQVPELGFALVLGGFVIGAAVSEVAAGGGARRPDTDFGRLEEYDGVDVLWTSEAGGGVAACDLPGSVRLLAFGPDRQVCQEILVEEPGVAPVAHALQERSRGGETA